MAATFETSLAPVAVTFLQAGETETVAFNAGTGANRVLIVAVLWREEANSISGVTYNGVALTSLGAKVTESAIISAQLWRLAGPASGSNNIQVTMGSGNNDSAGLISAWVANGVDQATPTDGYTTNQGNTTTAGATSSVTVTSQTDDRVAVFMCARNDTDNDTATPTNYTERQDANDGGGRMMELGDAAGAASVAASALWTNGAGENFSWIALGVNVNADGGGGGGPQLPWLPRHTNLQGPTGAIMLPGGMTPPSKAG